MNGFFLVDKPVGWTSFDVCARLRRLLNVKRVGHTGTLDPFASGLLLVAVGKCTKLIPFLERESKSYETEINFGQTSETLDPESEVLISSSAVEEEVLNKILCDKFTGIIKQVPPAYSALKVDGKRAYELARKGMEVKMKSRITEIFDIKLIKFDELNQTAQIFLKVAAGFYVRSFARDLATALETIGMCGSLRRTSIGSLQVYENKVRNYKTKQFFNYISPDLLVNKNSDLMFKSTDYLIDPKEILVDLPSTEIPTERIIDFRQGRAWKSYIQNPNEVYNVLVLLEGRTIGLALHKQGSYQPKVVF